MTTIQELYHGLAELTLADPSLNEAEATIIDFDGSLGVGFYNDNSVHFVPLQVGKSKKEER